MRPLGGALCPMGAQRRRGRDAKCRNADGKVGGREDLVLGLAARGVEGEGELRHWGFEEGGGVGEDGEGLALAQGAVHAAYLHLRWLGVRQGVKVGEQGRLCGRW